MHAHLAVTLLTSTRMLSSAHSFKTQVPGAILETPSGSYLGLTRLGPVKINGEILKTADQQVVLTLKVFCANLYSNWN